MNAQLLVQRKKSFGANKLVPIYTYIGVIWGNNPRVLTGISGRVLFNPTDTKPRKLTNDNGKSTMNEDVFFLLKTVISSLSCSFSGG